MSTRKSEHRASKSEQRARKAEWRMIREFLKNGTRRFRVLRSAETTFGKYGRVGGRCLPAPTFQERHGDILHGLTAASSIQPMPNPYRSRRDPFDDTKEWRSRYGSCEDCGAAQDEWCRPDCGLIDPMDMR